MVMFSKSLNVVQITEMKTNQFHMIQKMPLFQELTQLEEMSYMLDHNLSLSLDSRLIIQVFGSSIVILNGIYYKV
ncbi:unnamed protein product [[Candida] boidinii]|nr:unnamed protein product [[Candida] boidinii]